MDNLTRDFEAVKNENKNLKLHLGKIQEEMHRKETRLALGQVAWILEAEIWKIVLPDVKMGTTRILIPWIGCPGKMEGIKTQTKMELS